MLVWQTPVRAHTATHSVTPQLSISSAFLDKLHNIMWNHCFEVNLKYTWLSPSNRQILYNALIQYLCVIEIYIIHDGLLTVLV